MGIILDDDTIEISAVIGINFNLAACVLFWVNQDGNDSETIIPFRPALSIARALGWATEYDINVISYHIEYYMGEVTLNAKGYTLSD